MQGPGRPQLRFCCWMEELEDTGAGSGRVAPGSAWPGAVGQRRSAAITQGAFSEALLPPLLRLVVALIQSPCLSLLLSKWLPSRSHWRFSEPGEQWPRVAFRSLAIPDVSLWCSWLWDGNRVFTHQEGPNCPGETLTPEDRRGVPG